MAWANNTEPDDDEDIDKGGIQHRKHGMIT